MNAAHASMPTTLLFYLLFGTVVTFFGAGAQRAMPEGGRLSWRLVSLAMFVALVMVPGALAMSGNLDDYGHLPAPALMMVAAATLFTIGVACSPVGKAFATNIPLASLIWFQFFRVGVELCLHRLYVEGVIPVVMTYAGRNFDIISGVSAALVAIAVAKGYGSRTLVLVWNVVGLGLLINIVAIAVLSTPVSFRAFTDGPPNLLPSTFPFVFLPTVLVQAALFGHMVVFRALMAKRT